MVRTALYVDPVTAQVTARSDPIPRILQGIPLDVRSISLRMDRPSFTLNPTSCEAMTVAGEAVSTLGRAAPLSSRFQVGACGALGFKPKLGIRLFGPTRRAGHPKLQAVLRMPAGNANIARTTVALPHSEFLDQGHIKTVCTRVQFGADQCPAGSVYGHARAITPLLDKPLEGPVYLRSNGGERTLPDLVAALRGQIDVDVVGFIDSVHGGIRTRFNTVPDAPVSKFILTMRGGAKGLLQNSRNLCAHRVFAKVAMGAHNGRRDDFRSSMSNACQRMGAHPSRLRPSGSATGAR